MQVKLGEQRRFVLWWDGQPKDKGGGDVRNTAGRSASGAFVKPDDFGLDFSTLKRWRKRLKDPAKFDAALVSAQERCVKAARRSSPSPASSGKRLNFPDVTANMRA